MKKILYNLINGKPVPHYRWDFIFMELAKELRNHYDEAEKELNLRINDSERGFDVYDRLYRNHIQKSKWPFNARVTDGRATTIINRKTDRLLANRMTGKMVRTGGGGSEIGARIQTELIHWQWSNIDNCTDEPMMVRLRKLDLSARRYGAGFALVPWRANKRYEGPTLEPLENRDVLLQPGAKSIDDSEWVQVRRYVSIASLKRANEQARAGEIYKNIDKLKEVDSADTNYTSVNRTVVGVSGQEQKRVEIVTEYRRDRFITFAPKQGESDTPIILSDIKNPYAHGEIPVIRLAYYPIDDDIYGLPELENCITLIKTSWALLSQYLEGAQIDLYSPLMINPTETQMDTIKFEKGARWIMERPGQSVVQYQAGLSTLSQFRDTFGIITSLIMEGAGETAQDISAISQDVGTDKTATEIKDMASLRTARDNSNKTILRQVLCRMVYLWTQMNKQFINEPIKIAISGKDALQYLINERLHSFELNNEGAQFVFEYSQDKNIDYATAYEELRTQGLLENYARPLFPTEYNGGVLPQLDYEEGQKSAGLIITPKDMEDDYAYQPDIEAMTLNDDALDTRAKLDFFDRVQAVEPQLMQEGTKIKWQNLLESIAHSSKLRDPDQYFELQSNEPQQQYGTEQTGTGEIAEGATGGGVPQQPVLPEIPTPIR